MKSDVCFIVASMEKRVHFLNRCIQCFKNSSYKDCDIYLYFQGGNASEIVDIDIFNDIVVDEKPRGVFTPRYELLKRFGINYDYVIIIDDDLYILQNTDYWKTIKFVQAMSNTVVVALSNTKVTGRIEQDGNINIEGGLVLPNRAVVEILNYFKDREKDYTFDYFWFLCYVKGFDLYRDRRSRAQHVPVRKVNGEYSGFNYSLVEKPYIPMLTEYFKQPKMIRRHGRTEPNFTRISDLTEYGKQERMRNRAKLQQEAKQCISAISK